MADNKNDEVWKVSELTLHDKLLDIQQRLKVPKDKRNDYSTSKFMYRNLEAIEEAVKPLLKEHNLTLAFSDEVVAIGDRVFVKAKAIISDGQDQIFMAAYAQHAESKKGMDDAQLTGSCSSYARKYAAGGLFLIDETKDADSMDNSPQAPKKAKKGYNPSADHPITDDQRMMITNLLRKKGVEGKDAINEYMYDNFGAVPGNELEAYEVISSLDAKEIDE